MLVFGGHIQLMIYKSSQKKHNMDTKNDGLEKVCNLSIFYFWVQLVGPLSSWMPPHWLRNTPVSRCFCQFSRQRMLLLAEQKNLRKSQCVWLYMVFGETHKSASLGKEISTSNGTSQVIYKSQLELPGTPFPTIF